MPTEGQRETIDRWAFLEVSTDGLLLWNVVIKAGIMGDMDTRLTTYLFRDGHFAPSGDTVVCFADRAAVEAALGRGQLEALFQGSAVYADDAMKLDYIGVWGARNASRLRQFLRECGFEIVIDRQRPTNVRLRYFSHRRRYAGPFPKQRTLSVRPLRES
jgi:hypothetical protein